MGTLELSYGFCRVKLPKGLSHPLKRSVLDEALSIAAISNLRDVFFGRKHDQDPWIVTSTSKFLVLRASYCGDRAQPHVGQSSIAVYAIPSTERAVIAQQISAELLPKMIRWLQAIDRASPDSTLRAANRHFTAWRTGGTTSTSTGRFNRWGYTDDSKLI